MYTPAPTRITVVALLICMLLVTRLYAIPTASFTVSQNLGCAPLTVQFNNTSTGASSYYWDLGNGNSSTLQNPVNVYTVPGNYSITLIAFDVSGASDTAVIPNYITIVADPVADFSAPVTASCLDGNAITFINNSVGASGYVWDFGDGVTSSQVNPVHTYLDSGSYSVSLLATNSFGCSATKSIKQYITIHSKPQASIFVNSNVACDTSAVFQFSANNNSVTSWYWQFGDGTSSVLPGPSHSYQTAGSYHVSLQVTNSFGCVDTTDADSIITIYSHGWFSIYVNNDSGCAPYTAAFGNNFSSGSSYLWRFGDGTTSTQNFPSHTYATGGDYTVSAVITLMNGCKDSVSMNNLVHVENRPAIAFTSSDSSGCSPASIQFTNLSSNYTSCVWNFGDGSSSTLINPSHTYIGSGSYNVTLSCSNSSGCSSSMTQRNLINIMTPVALFSASPRSGCPPLDVNFQNTSLGNTLTYAWDFGDGSTSTQYNPLHTYTSAGDFNITLTITDSVGCSSTLTKAAYVQLTNPSAGYVSPPTTTGCVPLTTNFNDATPGAISWLWDFGDGSTSTAQNPSHTYTVPGLYTVSLTTQTAGGGCTQVINNFSSYDVQGGYAAFTDTFDQCPPYDVQFYDSSLNAVSWLWNFGDGSVSTLQNPSHGFAMPGYHTVSLSIVTSAGCTYNIMQSNGIYFAPFGANFYSVPQSTTFPMTVNFYSNSVGATGWIWDFGDSTSSNLENPSHTYIDSGDYNVTLTIYNDLCTLFYDPPTIVFSPPDSGVIGPPPTGSPFIPQKGCAPFNVSFNYNVPGAVDWKWFFGDGDSADTRYPIHTYLNSGIYSVQLVTTDSFGTQTPFVFDTIIHVSSPQALFSYLQSPNCQNTQIDLTNNSTGTIKYLWDFGDGTFDSTFSPVHIYTSQLPNYIITLRVEDQYGCQDVVSTSIFASPAYPIIISESDICGYDSVHFNSGLLNYASYSWDFGDGTFDSIAAPVHVYQTAGNFIPSLTVTDGNGCTQTFVAAYPIHVNLPRAGLSAPVTHGCDKFRVDFVNSSSGADSYLWNFGDGTTSSGFEPSHTYSIAGSYTVSLKVFKDGCADSISYIDYIRLDTAHAEFSSQLSGICIPFTATFTDLSSNAVSWIWEFGDFDSSSVQHPVHVYDSIYPKKDIALYITDINGCRDTAYQERFHGPAIDYTADKTTGCVPLTVTLNGTFYFTGSFLVDFGDGSPYKLNTMTHTYTTPGTYYTRIIVFSHPTFGTCTDTSYYAIPIHVVDPKADFDSPDLSACAPSLVQFNNLSSDADTYIWDFGDGTISNSFNTSHLYKTPGFYSVSLIAQSNEGCSDTMTRIQYVKVFGSQTNFSLSDTTGCVPLTVSYIDSSKDAVTWLWNFGDGYTSTDQFPVHTYSDTGNYTVALITSDTTGCTSYFEYPNTVHVNSLPVADFSLSDSTGCGTLTTNFTNLSGNFSTVTWNFGDGLSSSVNHPVHTYSSAGQYFVSLIVTNAHGCSDTSVLNQPVVVNLAPQAAFAANATLGCSPLVVTFSNLSTDTSGATFLWNFGNGQTSSVENPSVVFPNPGLYSVSLTVTNNNGCTDSVLNPSMIHVHDTLPPNISDIMSVSVTSDTTVEIIWENNAAIDLGAYRLFRLNPATGNYDNIYTDTNPNNSSFALTSSYTDKGLNTLHNTYSYKLQTLDICQNTIGLDLLRAHTTINVEAQVSGLNIRVEWNEYGGCAVNTYEIFRMSSSSAFLQIAVVPGDSLGFTDSSIVCPDVYTYKIIATDLCSNPYNSHSDTAAAMPLNIYADQKVEMVRSTVIDNNYVLTEWLPPTVKPQSVMLYEIYRSANKSDFQYLTSVSPLQTDYADYDVDVQSQQYDYKILVINSCNVAEELSGNTTTILLRGEKTEDRIVHLKWSPYNAWDSGVDYYLIERLDENGQWKVVKQVKGNITNLEFRE